MKIKIINFKTHLYIVENINICIVALEDKICIGLFCFIFFK